ncbi:uncharacterized protein LOC135345231 isoform X2 [Halichondria panicea]
MKSIIKIKPVPIKEKKPSCFECFKRKKKVEDGESEELLQPPEELPSTELSPEMEKANSEGYDMMKNVFFPSIPALVQDLWVYLELGISIAAFVIGILGTDFPLESNVVFQIVYLILTCIAMVMALMDGFIYFFQLGSCARGIRVLSSFLKKRKKKRQAGEKGKEEEEEEEEEEDEDEDEDEGKTRCGMSSETREKFNTWFELARNLINEFLIYPLLIFDMFALISEGENGGYLPEPDDENAGREQADFGFVVIGSFYLILAVYIMRVVMVFGTLLSLIRLPSNKEASGTDKETGLLIKFCIHIIGQIAVHFIIVVVLWAKIRNENQPLLNMNSNSTMNGTAMMTMNNANNTMGDDDEPDPEIRASAFLIAACVMGGIVPLVGVTAFFVVNYFWMREFSIGFWLNMISMLQGAGFAETVFGGEGLSGAEEQANQFLDDSGFDTVKAQITRLKEQTFWTKFFYPTKVPFVALCGVVYDLALVAFVAALMLTNDEAGVRLVVFQNDPFMTSAFVIATSVIVIANIHVLILLNFLLLVMVFVGIIAIFYSFALIPIILLVYMPMVGFVGYYFIFKKSVGNCRKKSNIETEDIGTTISTKNLDQDLELSEFNGDKSKYIETKGGNETAMANIDYSGKASPLMIANTSLTESYA